VVTPEQVSDLFLGGCRHLTAEIHDNLARVVELRVAALGQDGVRSQVEVIGDDLDDKIRCDLAAALRGDKIL